MKTNYNQDYPYQDSLNFFSTTSSSTQNAQKNFRPYNPQQVKAQIEGAVDTQLIQPQTFAYNIQQSAYGNHQHIQKQILNSQQNQNQALSQNFNNSNIINKNQAIHTNRQSKGQNSNNNTSSGNSNFNGNNATTTTMRAGDWICLICNNLNFSFRNECNRCRIQTKQQNYIQNMMICSQDKLNSTFNPQLVIPTPQLINYEIAQEQQQQNHQIYHRIQQQQQAIQKSHSQNQQFQQPFIPLLNMNLKKANSEKENKEPQPSFTMANGAPLGTQINMVNINNPNPSVLQTSYNQDAQTSKGSFNNSYLANQGANQNASFQFNQSLQSECINLNTPQLFYPNNNQKFNDFKQNQYQYLQNQNQQQLYNSSQISKLNDLNNQQQFKQNFQYNFNQISNQSQYQQPCQFESQNFQLPFQFKQNISQNQQPDNSSQINGNILISQQEIYQQRQMHFMMYQQQLLLQQQKNPAVSQNLNQTPHLLNFPQVSGQPLQNELQNQFHYPKNNMQQFLIDNNNNNTQRSQLIESQDDSQNQMQSDQTQNQQTYFQQQQCTQEHNKYEAKCEKEKQFEYQLNSKEESKYQQSVVLQSESKQQQQSFYFPHQINFLQKSMVFQQPQGLTLNNFNVIQKPSNVFQQQQQQQQQLPSRNQQISQGVNEICGIKTNKTLCNGNFSNQEQNSEINKHVSQPFPQPQNCTTNSFYSLNLWSGPQKGYENRLLVTPPKAKQFQQQNLPLSDIENLITQFKLMYSTEKKSQAKSIHSDNKSESHSTFFGSTQKEIPNSNKSLNFKEYQEDLIQEKGEIQILNQGQQNEETKSPEKIVKQIDFNEDNTLDKDEIENQELKNIKENRLNLKMTQKTQKIYIEKYSNEKEDFVNHENQLQNSQQKFNNRNEEESGSKHYEKKSFKFQQSEIILFEKENCKDCENRNQADQNADVSQISTQILSKQSTKEKCDKYLSLDEIITTPLKQVEDQETENAIELQKYSNNNSETKQTISQIV
ncbi:zinc finger, Ran-binding protein (macronuclear) [Tetrahymena thermophila SB210]|uniref:Zinc finger, Ran-binding protein n=1 Tax=Tetrahymena thermophila (strain SB210) TaxID=312017 RepID=Q24DK6_TETTS|nr:zinc finger, Ran-binding protein [Tetrahymena thermophila SB210]EAS05842.1 zinc finger, Ran-binding protein [Tetrahymena thermophila SB210]|eukprot:XP_001026087.1 zinc finger, Ran-binding protein [Tetrahymena thermophila SB210]